MGCWICGLVYEVSKWKSTLRWRCTLWPIVTQGKLEKGKRTSVVHRHHELMQGWLAKESQRPERTPFHWPIIEEPQPRMLWLRCQKCSTTSLLAHKRVFMETKCASIKKDRLDEACSLHQEAQPGQDVHQRGGHSFRAMTLNVGTLKDRVQMIAPLGVHICCLQETCVPPSMWASVSVRSAIRAENESIVLSHIDSQDMRGRYKLRTRQGVGVAVAAFHPFVANEAGHLFVTSGQAAYASRLSTAVVTGPQVCVLVHSVYLSYQDEEVNQCVIQELLRRIGICGGLTT